MEWIKTIRAKARQGAQPPSEFVALDHLLHDMRLYKSSSEVKVMKHAAEISARAHIRAMQASRAGLFEYHLEAELDYEFRKGGAKMPAYGSVAAGRNACILHYRENDAPLKDGDLVLIDAGCEIDCYASDITAPSRSAAGSRARAEGHLRAGAQGQRRSLQHIRARQALERGARGHGAGDHRRPGGAGSAAGVRSTS